MDRIIHRRWTQINADVERAHDGQCSALAAFAAGKAGWPPSMRSAGTGFSVVADWNLESGGCNLRQGGGGSGHGRRSGGKTALRRTLCRGEAVAQQRCVPGNWKATATTLSAHICVHRRLDWFSVVPCPLYAEPSDRSCKSSKSCLKKSSWCFRNTQRLQTGHGIS